VNVDFSNAYEDDHRAAAYATLEFDDTYYLAFRDLPQLYARYVPTAGAALDFGCGTGRSTRFLVRLGYRAVGVDISAEMLRQAWKIDPAGDYRQIGDGDFSAFSDQSFDLIQSAFTFDNVPKLEHKRKIFEGFRRLLRPGGVVLNLVSTPEIYLHEWASFSTRDFPENRTAKCGDVVKIITTTFADARPCLDVLFPDEDYRRLYEDVSLEFLEHHLPLADGTEPYRWKSETTIAPWSLYLLRRPT
jgi:SAM-dependent methyltransferase